MTAANGSDVSGHVDADEILQQALGELEDLPGSLVEKLLAELEQSATGRANRIQDAIERAADDRAD